MHSPCLFLHTSVHGAHTTTWKQLLAAELGLPVSAKIRVVHGGVDGTVTFAKRLEEAGASMLTLHGRRPEQRDHQGPSDLDAVKGT